jgi:hypothetical protein
MKILDYGPSDYKKIIDGVNNIDEDFKKEIIDSLATGRKVHLSMPVDTYSVALILSLDWNLTVTSVIIMHM